EAVHQRERRIAVCRRVRVRPRAARQGSGEQVPRLLTDAREFGTPLIEAPWLPHSRVVPGVTQSPEYVCRSHLMDIVGVPGERVVQPTEALDRQLREQSLSSAEVMH